MSYSFGAVILAAGKGTRMKMDMAKPLVPLLERHLVDYPMKAVLNFFNQVGGKNFLGVVTGHDREEVEAYLKNTYGDIPHFAYQEEQLGTADALKTYYEKCPEAKSCEYTLVMCADTPIIQSEDLETLYHFIKEQKLDGVAATFIENLEHRYGRIMRSEKGFRIVEDKDADDEVKKINEVNSGLYILRTEFVLEHINKIDSNNKSGEFYLTDLFKDEYKVAPLLFERKETFWGVNDLRQLSLVERELMSRKKRILRDNGVRFVDFWHTYIYEDVEVGSGAFIHPNVIIQGKSVIEEGAIIGAGSVITDSHIGKNAVIKPYSVLDSAKVEAHAQVGPFARLRPGAEIGEEAKIGNFVEVKNARFEKGAQSSHLSYIGDASIGEGTNIGCGFITCNYDGGSKHQTKIGKNCFIGSDTQAIAPLEIGDNCYVGSGSTLTQSMEDGDFAVARARQATKPGLARRFMKGKYLERLLNKLSK